MVVDSTDRERLSLAKEELHKMAHDEALAGAAMLVMANKQDVRGYVLFLALDNYVFTDLLPHLDS